MENPVFLRLFVKHPAALQCYARALLPTWAAVEDVLQEASVVMWRKLGQLESEDGFLPWAKTIVRFEALRAARKVARDRLVFSEDVLEQLAQEAEEVCEEERLHELETLRQCLGRLKPHHRDLMLTSAGGGVTVRHLAERAGYSANAFLQASRAAAAVLAALRGAFAPAAQASVRPCPVALQSALTKRNMKSSADDNTPWLEAMDAYLQGGLDEEGFHALEAAMRSRPDLRAPTSGWCGWTRI